LEILAVDTSIVLLAEDHNPSILNADFLRINEIVPDEWNLQVGENLLTSPAASQVEFIDSVSIQVDDKRVRITDSHIDGKPLGSRVPQIALRYARTLQHVKYTAMGTNFRFIMPNADPSKYVISRFTNTTVWQDCGLPLQSVDLEIRTPPMDGRQLNLKTKSLKLQQQEDESVTLQAISVEGNIHRQISSYPATEEIEKYTREFEADWVFLNGIMEELFRDDT